MSEQNNDEEIMFKIHAGDGEYECRPENSIMFHFIGKTVLGNGVEFDNQQANHLFHIMEETDEGELRGRYIFLGQEAMSAAMPYMINNGYTVHLNIREVGETDMSAYQTFTEQVARHEAENLDDELNKLLEEGDD